MKSRTLVILGAVLLASLTRLLPHPPNVAPMTAMAVFGAATLVNRRLALLTPLLALLISDAGIEILHRKGLMDSWGFYPHMWVTYASLLLVTLVGFLLRQDRRSPLAIGGVTLAGAVVFFLVTNFAVWALGDGLHFPRTLAGLIACYVAALPFFGFSLVGDAVYATVLFGGFALAEKWLPALRQQPLPAAAAA